ncbi:SseB protein N-terminal domain-containing protein [Meinhardsimonia xiamenensis]|jgi:hypothetical protein|uniref:SseB protein N-terminal domain-containing protein n=1 Tax=Meinhardsimonia xiamenensis TaxID=990712 RepID=A0A1G9EDB1_9RHOB|nr:SseB family protein [Meinhardsimonia xiamenensis]PRX33822.1 type III secretion system (T3SS) SseB-like protein [Meinhardsimonia xiamenensis]SDK74058.1 SseB protein N-terminal domain-containing protein [Meinhardsimonia xiamenensis]
MTAPTPLDRAHAAMAAAPENEAARLAFYRRLADAELFLMLREEPRGEEIEPEVFEVEGAPHVLAFDTEERLADFAARPVPHVALSGRTLARLLAGQGAGLGLNLGVRASETVLPPEAVAWLAAALPPEPRRSQGRIVEARPPAGVPEALLEALAEKLAAAAGLAQAAWLAEVRYESGAPAQLLAFEGALPGAQEALARACGEALSLSGIDAGALDVTFLEPGSPAIERLSRVALRFDIPEAPTETVLTPAAPGTDPGSPPKLR